MSLFSGRRGEPGAPEKPSDTPQSTRKDSHKPISDQQSHPGGTVADIGKSIVFKGDLSGDEDLQIDDRTRIKAHTPVLS